MQSSIRLFLTAVVGAIALLAPTLTAPAQANQQCKFSPSSTLSLDPPIQAVGCANQGQMGIIGVLQKVQLTSMPNEFHWQTLAKQPIRALQPGEMLMSTCWPTRNPGPGLAFFAIVDGRPINSNYPVKAAWALSSSGISLVSASGPAIFCKSPGALAGE